MSSPSEEVRRQDRARIAHECSNFYVDTVIRLSIGSECSALMVRFVYTSSMEVGIRELRGSLSEYLARVRAGDELVVTDRGKAFARIVPIAGGRALDRAIADGLVTPTSSPSRTRPAERIRGRGIVSDLVAEQRR